MEDFYAFLPKTEEEYLQTRVLDQTKWYDDKSKTNKMWFLYLKITEIILSLFIPFLSAYINSSTSPLKIIVGILGIMVAAIAGIITLIKFQENWIEYRTVAESLKLEKFLFLSKAGPYKEASDTFPFFVERFESLISTSTKKWVNYIAKNDVEPNKKAVPE